MQARWTALLATGLMAVVPLASPTPSAAVRMLGAPLDPGDPTGPVLAVVGLLAWALACWLGFGALLVAAGRLPGVAGHLAGAAAARALPGTVRRGLEVALGAALVVGTVGVSPAAAVSGEQDDRLTVTQVLPDVADLSLDWPTTRARASAPAPAPGGDPTGVPATSPAPATGAPNPVAPPPVAPSAPNAPTFDSRSPMAPSPLVPMADSPTRVPSLLGAARTAPSARSSGVRDGVTTGGAVVVRPGDTLWGLASRELRAAGIAPTEAAVAARWPVWWGANRAVIGNDPDLLRPGTSLTPPGGT